MLNLLLFYLVRFFDCDAVQPKIATVQPKTVVSQFISGMMISVMNPVSFHSCFINTTVLLYTHFGIFNTKSMISFCL